MAEASREDRPGPGRSSPRTEAGVPGASAPALLPFDGEHAAARLAAGRAGRPLRTFGADRSGTRTYAFSSLGYRGAELDPRAARRVFVAGASVTFGIGLDEDEAWPARFRARYAAHHGLPADAVNLLNFSAPLAPPDWVVRTLLTQASRIRPDLVIAQLSKLRRVETVRDGAFTALSAPLTIRVHASSWRGLARAPRVSVVSARDELLAFLRNALLIQFFCAARGIDFLLLWDRRPWEPYDALLREPVVAPLIALLDRRSWCPFSVFDRDVFVDRSADGDHPGPASTLVIASRLIERYRALRPARADRAEPQPLAV